MRLAWASLALLLAVSVRAESPSWEALESQGTRVSAVDIRIQDVFDLSDPAQDHWIGRLANQLHLTTRKAVIRRALTFRVGERVEARRIHESERELRSFRFLKDARIDPEVQPDGSVVARVWVRDAWTLKASVGYSRVGGQPSWSFGLRDHNLLGFGKDLGIHRDTEVDQSSTTFLYQDRQFLGSRWNLATSYQALSDGKGRGLELERPFFALDTPWAVALSASNGESLLRVYDQQNLVYTAPEVHAKGSVGGAWLVRQEAGSALRLGLRFQAEDQRYGSLASPVAPGGLRPPDLSPRRLRGAALTWEWVEDGFRAFHDLLGMDTPEDYNLGWSGHGSAGLFSRAWGSSGTGPFFEVDLAKGWAPAAHGLVLLQAGASGRKLDGRIENGLGSLNLTGYEWSLPRQVLAANLAMDGAIRPDPEKLLYLGGLEGLRGYPNFMYPGDRRWMVSLEDRILTEWRWLGMLRAGFVVYADAGAIRRLDGTGWTRPYSDLGAGLRFGDLKSSLGRVVLLTVAVPLSREPGQDRYQVLVGNTVRF